MNKPETIAESRNSRIPSAEELGFDPQELRKKYDYERDRRLRAEGEAQYQDTDGDLYHYNDDPYITERIERDAVQEDIEVAVLGGGFGGLYMAARTARSGDYAFSPH